MRIINLDETGIKLIASNKRQLYLSTTDIKKFIAKHYKIKDNILTLEDKELLLTKRDVEEFGNTYTYIETNFKD